LSTNVSNITSKIKFRTYTVRTEPNVDITIVDAALATCANPSYFPSVAVGPRLSQREYVGGSMGVNNPCKEVISESWDLFGGDTRVACLLSLGTGHLGVISLSPERNEDEGYLRALQAMANDSEQTAQEVDTQMGHLGMYFRFSVEQGLQATEKSTIDRIMAHTKNYIENGDISRKVEHVVERIKLRQGLVALNQLSEFPSFRLVSLLTLSRVFQRGPALLQRSTTSNELFCYAA
jgi:hypothetical protein